MIPFIRRSRIGNWLKKKKERKKERKKEEEEPVEELVARGKCEINRRPCANLCYMRKVERKPGRFDCSLRLLWIIQGIGRRLADDSANSRSLFAVESSLGRCLLAWYLDRFVFRRGSSQKLSSNSSFNVRPTIVTAYYDKKFKTRETRLKFFKLLKCDKIEFLSVKKKTFKK